MRHIFLRFTYGVEIGARLAYLGHYQATKDPKVLEIANEEREHQRTIETILTLEGKETFFLFNWFFFVVGTFVRIMCLIAPKFMLNPVAQVLEIFAIFSYTYLSKLYPDYNRTFRTMAITENKHEAYFKKLRVG